MAESKHEPMPGMVEKSGRALWLTHVFMIVGVLIVFFPIWLAFDRDPAGDRQSADAVIAGRAF